MGLKRGWGPCPQGAGSAEGMGWEGATHRACQTPQERMVALTLSEARGAALTGGSAAVPGDCRGWPGEGDPCHQAREDGGPDLRQERRGEKWSAGGWRQSQQDPPMDERWHVREKTEAGVTPGVLTQATPRTEVVSVSAVGVRRLRGLLGTRWGC